MTIRIFNYQDKLMIFKINRIGRRDILIILEIILSFDIIIILRDRFHVLIN